MKYKGFLRKNLNELEGLYPTNVKNITDAQVNQNNLIKFVNEFQSGIVSWMGHGNWDGTARKIWAVDYDNNGYPTSNEIKWDYFISNNIIDKFNIKNPSIISWYFPNLTYESFENNPSMYSINAMFLSYLSSKISVSESVNKTFVWYYERFWNQSEYLNKNIAHNIYCLNLFGEPIISLDSFTEKVSNPRVISTYPSNNQSDVPTNVEIVVKFDRNIDKRTVTSTNFILQEGTKIIQGNLNYNEKDFSIVFKPLTELKKGTLYNVTIKKEIKDNFGNTLQGDLNFHLKQFHKLRILLLFFKIKMKVIK